MAKQWNYANAGSVRVGLMVCTACHNSIDDGPFRYRATDAGYLPQHRSCSANDPQWSLLDRRDQAQQEHERRRQEAYKSFVAEFGVPYDLVEQH